MKNLWDFLKKIIVYIFGLGILSQFVFLIPVNNNFLLILIFAIVIIFFRLIPLIKDMVAKRFGINSVQSNLWNELIVIFMSFIFISVLSTVIYFKSFDIIGQSTLYKFVSNNKIEKEILLTNEESNKLDLEPTIKSILNELKVNLKSIKDKPALIKLLSENPKEVKKYFSENSKLMKYISEKNMSIDDIIDMWVKTTKVHENFILTGYYIGILLLIIYIILNCHNIFIVDNNNEFKIILKKRIYMIAFIIYIISFIDNQNDGLLLYWINSKMQNGIPYEDLQRLKYFLNAFKESFLTFIIFDTIINYQDIIKEKNYITYNENSKLLEETKFSIDTISKNCDSFNERMSNIEINMKRIQLSNSKNQCDKHLYKGKSTKRKKVK